ncbi:MAG: hypothetical protein KAI81_03150, partial [Candidatus Marinimicrobia bacterium]|nr:hypothetical protein [Candidatus Neomarinimicrobiota bacterium]
QIIVRLLILIILASSLGAEADLFSIKHYFIGHFYENSKIFSESCLIFSEEGKIKILRNENDILPPLTMKLINYWAIPALKLPLQFVDNDDKNIETNRQSGVVDLRFVPGLYQERLCEIRGSSINDIYIHGRLCDSLPTTVLRWQKDSDESELHAFDIQLNAISAYLDFMEEMKKYILFKVGKNEYSPEIFRNSSLKDAASELSNGLPPLIVHTNCEADSGDWVLLDSLIRSNTTLRILNYPQIMNQFTTIDPALIWNIFDDAAALHTAIRDSLINIDFQRILLTDYTNWMQNIRKYKEIPLLDIMSRNVQEFYNFDMEANNFTEGQEAELYLLDGNPFVEDVTIVYIMRKGLLHYAFDE